MKIYDGGSLDIRVDDEDFTEQNAPNQKEEKENVFPNNTTSVDRISAIDPKPHKLQRNCPILKAQLIRKNIYLLKRIYLKILLGQWMNSKQP